MPLSHRSLLLLLAIPAASLAGQAQSVTVPNASGKEFSATRLPSGGSLVLDGRLDDDAWTRTAWRTDFTQKEPVEGGEPSGRTEIAFLYDDNALYVGARMHSADASKIPTTV
ncbi:MAG: hypothetical protein SF070_13885, partial [Gemmatimonadota bacterium]|nr:hypothetical protein [Gemmatimonadota bacterium]